MAKKKPVKAELVGNLDPKYWVQKSDPLMLMRSIPFSLGEFKILDTYISRINAADDSCTTVIFTKAEYEKLMGIEKTNAKTLEKYTNGMLSKIVTLKMPNGDFMKFTLFTKAYYHKDNYDVPVIELSCSLEAKDLFFCIGKYHYFKYALENIINLTRKASYLLYLHILTNRYRGTWETSLDELRDNVLDCKEQESYKEYKIFKNRVLDPAVKEVNAKTDCHFEYEALKRGRRVTDIRFIYLSSGFENTNPNQITLEQTQNSVEQWQNLNPELWEDVVKDFSFSKEQIEEIRSILQTVPDFKLPQDLAACTNNIDIRRYHYMAQQVARLKRYETTSKIKNRYAYLLKMIKVDAEEI